MAASMTATVQDHHDQGDMELRSISMRGSDQNLEEAADLQAVLSSTSTQRDSAQHRRQAILVVIASFVITFTGCGLNFAFGVYQELYETLGGPFEGASPASIDLIGTLAVALMSIGAPVSAALTKKYSPRTVTLVGGFILGLANVLASFGQQLWQFILTQGLLLGVGTCLCYMPAVTIPAGWFDARRGLAMGIVLSGTGVGGVVWAPVLRYLNETIGFRDTLRLTGAVGFGLIAAAATVMRWEPEIHRRNQLELRASASSRIGLRIPLVNWQLAKSRVFFAQAAGVTLHGAAYYLPTYFFSSYATTLGYSSTQGANFISASNATSAAGKVVLGYIADRFGRLNTLFVCALISAITTLGLWLPSITLAEDELKSSQSLFIAFVILYGIFAGAYVSLFPAALVELFGVQNFASVNGFLYMVRGIGTLVGTPLGGLLIRSNSGAASAMARMPLNYENTSILVGVLLAAVTACVFWVRLEAGGVHKLKA